MVIIHHEVWNFTPHFFFLFGFVLCHGFLCPYNQHPIM
jgi:hypothetical protein